jgi:hypothetical protein
MVLKRRYAAKHADSPIRPAHGEERQDSLRLDAVMTSRHFDEGNGNSAFLSRAASGATESGICVPAHAAGSATKTAQSRQGGGHRWPGSAHDA